MKRTFGIAVVLLASVALAGLIANTTVTGTTSQTAVIGFGAKIGVQCETASGSGTGVGFRYKTGNAAITATTADPYYDSGDTVKIDLPKEHDRIAIIHKDGTTSFFCRINSRIP